MTEDPGLLIERVRGREAIFLRLSGPIDDRFSADKLGALDAPTAIDLGALSAISAAGVRRFSEAMTIASASAEIYLLDCPGFLVDQLNLVRGFCARALVLSARAMFACDCGHDQERTVDVLSEGTRIRSGQSPEVRCDRCGSLMRLVEDDAFRFVAACGARRLDARVRATLLELGVYAAAVLEDRPLRVSKVVDGEGVAIRLDGAISARTRLTRAVEDEGVVALLLGGLFVRAEGAETFASLLQTIGERARELILVGVPPQLAGLFVNGLFPLGRAKVDSLLVPVRCTECAELALATLPLFTAPETLRCARCGAPTGFVGALVHHEALRENGAPSADARAFLERIDGLFSQAAVEARLVGRPRDPLTAAAELPVQIGGYRIVRPLSAGGMAEVLLASRESMGGVEKLVALKRFRRELFQSAPSAIAMFLGEARLAAQLSHPNVVQIFDVGEADGDLYMAMEFVDGRDLRELVDHGLPTPPHVAAHLVLEIARALAYLHDARDLRGRALKIVHRDVSPQNVLVDRRGRVVLIDFGVALAGEGELQKRRRKIAGNLAYMSPEQCYGEPLDGRSDLFSLGVVMWELLMGAPLFRREDVADTRKALLKAHVPPLDSVPQPLAELTMELLSRDREARPASAADVAQKLDALIPALGRRFTPEELGAFIDRTLDPHVLAEDRSAKVVVVGLPAPPRAPSYAVPAAVTAALALIVSILYAIFHR